MRGTLMIHLIDKMRGWAFLIPFAMSLLLVACETEERPSLGLLSATIDKSNPEVIECAVEVLDGTVIDCGFYYGTSQNAVFNGLEKRVPGVYNGSVIQGTISGVTPNKTYYIVAYGMNEKGMEKSNILQVKTASRIPNANDNKYPKTTE